MTTATCSRRLLPALALAVAASPAFAANATWNATAGNWSDITRWSTNPFYPNNGNPIGTTYDVTIPGGSVSLDIAPTINNLSLGTATLTGNNNLTILNSFSSSGDAVLAGNGTIFANNLTLTNTSLTMMDARNLTVTGLSTWANTDGFPQFISLTPTNTFTNTGTLTLNPATNSAWNGGNFMNTGVVNKIGATSLFLTSGLINNGTITVSAGDLTLNYGTHAGTFSTATGGSLTFTGTNTFSKGSSVAGAVTFADDAAFSGSTLSGDLSFFFTASFNAGTKINTNSLFISGNAILQTGTAASSTNTLTIAGSTNAWTGQLDLTTDALVIRANSTNKAATIATLQNQLAYGKNNGTAGTYTGAGITSSTLATAATAGTLSSAIALADNRDLNLTSFRGQNGLDANSLILAVAHNGDANLDNKVDAFDLNLLASHWQQTGALWSAGDFNGDGRVDAFDLNTLAANWQFGVATGLAQSFSAALAAFPQLPAAAPVPEPATLALVPGMAAALLLRRRRRRS